MTEGAADPVIAWLLEDAMELQFLDDVFAGVCNRLRDAGLPLDRATIHVRALHPQFRAVALRWHAGDAQAALVRVSEAAMQSDAYKNSPVRALFEGAEGLRQRLDLELPATSFSVYHDLKAQGFTDYVGLPLPFTRGLRVASSWTTRQAGGWKTSDLLEINRVRPLLAMASEIRIARRIARNIAETYIGRRAADRVLDGRIRRGDLETIEAAILYVDMRGYTRLTEQLPSAKVFERLNAFFDAFGGGVEANGGEILKFMGDGMLAAFPVEQGAENAVERAFDAACAGMAALDALNLDLEAAGEDAVGCGLGLHVGRVAFGNFGTEGRLDFTVVGPAVNLAARLEQLTREVCERFVLSEEAARAIDRPTRLLGRHAVRGLAGTVAVYAPAAST